MVGRRGRRMSAADAIAHATDQQQRAADPANSVWVSASAGTGKTKVLTDRVLSLLLQGTPPNRLLCLTFTKAAAAEMATRIIDKLGSWATIADASLRTDLAALTGRWPEPPELIRARQLFATVLDAPGGLKIQTIHAFCQSLLARFPLEAGIAPHFTVMDEATAEELRREARETVLARTRAQDLGGTIDPTLSAALTIVTDHVQEGQFGELLATLTFERGRLGRLIALHGGVEGLIAETADRLGVDPGETPEMLRARAATIDDALAGQLDYAIEGLALGSAKDQRCGAAIRTFLDRGDRRIEALDEYRLLFFTKAGELRKALASKACLDATPALRDILDREADRLAGIEARLKSAIILEASAALLRLRAALLPAYETPQPPPVRAC